MISLSGHFFHSNPFFKDQIVSCFLKEILVVTHWLNTFKRLLITQGFPGSSVGKESTCNAGDPSWISGLGNSAEEDLGYPLQYSWASLVPQLVKNQPAMQKDLGSIPGLGRSPGEGKGYLLQYSGLENSMDLYSPWGRKESAMAE